MRINKALGGNRALILRNHRPLGSARPRAGLRADEVAERAARIQLTMEATGGALVEIPAAICEKTAQQYAHHDSGRGSADWPAYLRMLDAIDPDWRN